MSPAHTLVCSRPLPTPVSGGGYDHARCRSGLPSIPRQPPTMPPSRRHRPNLNPRVVLVYFPTMYVYTTDCLQPTCEPLSEPFLSHHLDFKRHGFRPKQPVPSYPAACRHRPPTWSAPPGFWAFHPLLSTSISPLRLTGLCLEHE
ncbi:hypothetical protein LZ31DRAFT_332439 [Colletotrichum somersetense]|nr:hypothetical protein LZ31DRAFT_332439 [Colletotrichum somersetense]